MLYRAVEPAVSWTLACLVLGGLVRQLGEDPPETGGPAARRRWLGVLAGNALLPFAHFPVAVSLAVAETVLALVLLAGGRRLRSRAALAVAGAAAALAALGAALLADGPRTTAESVFRSRALLLSPALVLGAIGCAVLLERAYRRGLAPREAVALACLATPVVVNTQQLLTGVTLGPVAFEWGSDYLFVAAGGLLAVDWRAVPAGAGGRGVAGLALAALVALAGQGRLRTCATFEGENLRSVIEARALAAATAAGVRAPRVLLQNPYDDALLAIRLGGPLAAVMGGRDFPWLGLTGWSARFVPRGPAAPRVFEQYARLEMTPAEVERLVPRIQRVSRDNGEPAGFLGGYAAALAHPPAAWAAPVIYLTPAGPGAVSLGRRFDHQLVAQLAGVAGQTTARVYAYLQTARARPLDDPAAALLATLRARGQALALVDEPAGHSARRPTAAAPAAARLPDRLWRPARGVSVERRSEGLDVTTPPSRSAVALNTLPIRAAERGHHVFVLAGRSISGRAALRLLAGQAVRYWAFGRLSAPGRDGSALWVVEADLEAGEEVSLFLLNDHPAGDYASALLVGELRAFLWPTAGPAPISRAPGA
jgi:hypothetical protein